MNIKSLLSVCFVSFGNLVAYAQGSQAPYVLDTSSGTGVSFSIGYTLGVHKGTVGSATGHVIASTEGEALIQSALVTASLESFTTGNDTRDCHMREAMGLNYAVSDFPGQHVCSFNALPTSGPNAIAFPTVEFKLEAATTVGPNPSVESGAVQISAVGTWTLHGIAVQKPILLTLTRLSNDSLRVVGATQFSLAQHGIEVMPFAGLIKVSDTANVALDLVFKKQ